MERKQELMLLIRQLKADLCASASKINNVYHSLNESNLDEFKEEFKKHEEIHDNLVEAIEEYDAIESKRKLVKSLFR